jgi:hypothetical protein
VRWRGKPVESDLPLGAVRYELLAVLKIVTTLLLTADINHAWWTYSLGVE